MGDLTCSQAMRVLLARRLLFSVSLSTHSIRQYVPNFQAAKSVNLYMGGSLSKLLVFTTVSRPAN